MVWDQHLQAGSIEWYRLYADSPFLTPIEKDSRTTLLVSWVHIRQGSWSTKGRTHPGQSRCMPLRSSRFALKDVELKPGVKSWGALYSYRMVRIRVVGSTYTGEVPWQGTNEDSSGRLIQQTLGYNQHWRHKQKDLGLRWWYDKMTQFLDPESLTWTWSFFAGTRARKSEPHLPSGGVVIEFCFKCWLDTK